MRKHFLLALALVFAFLLPNASAQSVISARSGLVNFFEGVVFLDGQPLARKSGTFPHLRDGSTLVTESGRAEILLTPDTYLRLGENSSVRLISDSIADTQVELVSGSAMLDSAKAPAGEFVKVIFKNSTMRILKQGHYRLDAEPPQLRVFDGEAEVTRDGKAVKIQPSQLFPLEGAPIVKRFTQGSDGLLDLWSEERGELISSKMVNSQTITDPLLDSGPGVPADLASYIGYMPLATIAPMTVTTYGAGFAGPFSPYTSLPVRAFMPFPAASFLYAPQRYTSVFANRPAVGSATLGTMTTARGTGFAAPPRTIFVPRPIMNVPAPPRGGGPVGVRPGIHPAGRR
jgi:FecR protein